MKYKNTMSDLLRQVDQKSKELSEGKLNETGHDDVKSAKNQVQIAMSALQKMSGELGKLNDEDSLPTWWTNKVAVSVDKLDGMADYLDTQVESKQVNEESMKCPRCGTMNETPFDKCSNCGLPKAEFSSFKKEEVELDESKSSSGYELYHKDFSSAMQHAYDFAKKRMGVTVDKKEIDDKVATGSRKPSEGKTNSYRLRGKGGNLQIQVYNRCGSKPFELNMYKEEVELDEAVDPADVDVVATADDRKAADKNIIMQLRRLQDMKGKGKAMFGDGKPASINPKLIDYALKMHGKMKPQDKLKFQKAISKSYRDFLMTLKRTR